MNLNLLMSEIPISKEEIKQLLLFMNRIKVFEKIFIIQKDSMTRLIWGLFLFGAGSLSYVITEMVYQTESFGILTIVPWILAIFSGLIIQIFSDRHIVNIYSWEKPKREASSDTLFLILGFVLMAVLISFYNITALHVLTFPSVALISGFMVLVTDRKYYETNKEILNNKLFLITPVFCLLAASLMILLVLIDESIFIFHSVIFGTAFGGSFCITAYWNRKNIDSFLERGDLPSNS
ncbi:MAG: hypothetical protein ACFFB2_09140 [Promethearchaeota archaeon]